jgi:hypothetical protein
MDNTDIRDAIMLFQYSETASGGGGSVGKWPEKVLKTLWQLYKNNEIGFRVQPKETWRGSFLAGRAEHDLQLNPNYFNHIPKKDRLGALSLLLVHEGTHAALDFPRLFDELAARKLPIYYYRELSGPGVFNEASDPPLPGGRSEIVWLLPGHFPEFQKQSEYLNKEQLLDYVLRMDTYTTSDYLDAKWIVDHLGLWGGPKNRWVATKGLYIRILAKPLDPYYAPAILDIMESVHRDEDWQAMMDKAGPLHTVQLALDDLIISRRFSSRIAALERKWKVVLTDNTIAKIGGLERASVVAL